MPRTRPNRTLDPQRVRGMTQRKEVAEQYFRRGYKNAEVARLIGVHPDTVKRYRDDYEQRIRAEAASQPGLLRDVIKNAMESLASLDDARAEAWEHATASDTPLAVKATFLGIAIKCDRQKADILGLLGVKSDTTALYARIKNQQERLIEFMQNNLCENDRRLLESFLIESFRDDLDNIEDLATMASMESGASS